MRCAPHDDTTTRRHDERIVGWAAIPAHLHDTAYAAAFEVATVDLEMRMEERRVLQVMRRYLDIDAEPIAAIERATKARHRTLT